MLKDILAGAIIGISNIVPGISGGTVAVVLGVYEKILSAINGIKSDFKNSVVYLSKIGIGAVLGILMFSKVLTFLLEKYPVQTTYTFVGAIVGSIGVVSKKIINRNIDAKKIISALLGVIIVMIMFVFGQKTGSTETLDMAMNLKSLVNLFAAGFIAAITMILPGVSGSLTLVTLGLYDKLLYAVHTLNIGMLIPVALGAIVGLLSVSKGIAYIINKHNDMSYSFVLGLILASIYVMISGVSTEGVMMSSFVCFMVSCIIANMFSNYNAIKQKA